MDKFIRPSLALGAISGIVFGILLLIPLIAPFMFFFVFLLAGVIVVIFLKKTDSIGIVSLQDGCLIGALAGFSSLITTSTVYFPIAFLIDKLFNSYSQGFSLNSLLSATGYHLMAILMMVFFTAVLSAIMNAFSGMMTAFFFEKIEQKSFNFKDHLMTEQFDDVIE